MKKLFSLTALSALLYTMPASANFLFGQILNADLISLYKIIPYLFLILPILLVQAFLLRLALPYSSYIQALLAVCVGNIPSTVIGYNIHKCCDQIMQLITFPVYPNQFGLLFLIICNAMLMLITIAIFFRYPLKKLILPLFFGNLAAYFILVGSVILAFSTGRAH